MDLTPLKTTASRCPSPCDVFTPGVYLIMSPIDLMPFSSISSSVTIVRDWGTLIIGVGVFRALT